MTAPKDAGKVAQDAHDLKTEDHLKGKLLGRLEEVVAACAERADDPEKLFYALQDFTISMARALSSVLSVMEEAMHSKDHAYPKGVLTPTFLAAFAECASNCSMGIVKIPEEILGEMVQSAAERKSQMH